MKGQSITGDWLIDGIIVVGVIVGIFSIPFFFLWRASKKPRELAICPYCKEVTAKWFFNSCTQCGALLDRHALTWVTEGKAKAQPQEDVLPKTEDEVVALMESTKSATEWKANCEKVKRAFGGYPPFWYDAIIHSGVFNRVAINLPYGHSIDMWP